MENIPAQEISGEIAPVTGETAENPAVQQPAAPQPPVPQYPQPSMPQYPVYQAPLYPQPLPQYPVQPPVTCGTRAPEERKEVAITGFVFGVVGMVLSGIPVLNFILALVSIICSAIGRARGGCVARAYGAAGLTTGILTAVVVIGQIALASVLIRLMEELFSVTGILNGFEEFAPFLNMLFAGGLY